MLGNKSQALELYERIFKYALSIVSLTVISSKLNKQSTNCIYKTTQKNLIMKI